MVVMILERVPTRVRGDLSRWLIEPRAGVFVGHVNAMVRDKLWERCCETADGGAVIQIWSTNNEQRFAVRTYGDPTRTMVEYEGIWLVRRG